MTVQQFMDVARQHHRAGQLDQAQMLYRQILALQPDHSPALQLLAQVRFQQGKIEEAEQFLRRAIALEPRVANLLSNLGSILIAAGKVDQAIETIQRALVLEPNSADIHGNLANALNAGGMTDEAIAEFQRALALNPDLPQVHNNLGSSFRTKGDLDSAIEHFQLSLTLRPNSAETLMNLGHALREKKQWQEAATTYEQAVRLRPQDSQAHWNFANALLESGRTQEAMAAYRQALALRSDFAEAHYGLGCALRKAGELDQAMACFQRAVELKGDYGDAYNNLGMIFEEKGDFGLAITALSHAITINPDDFMAHNNLGIVYHTSGRSADAINEFRRTLEIRPGYPEALANLALVLSEIGQLQESIDYFNRALEQCPDQALALNNLANALKEMGRIDEALDVYRRATQTMNEPWAYDNLLFGLYTHPDYGPKEILEEHQGWARKFAEPLKPKSPVFDNHRTPDRRLRIGYVSPDFNEHPVGRFLLPLLSNHDREKFEIFCYSDVRLPDAVTEQLKIHTDVWRKTNGLTDERLAQMIRQDQIDILVDLTSHTKGNRLLVFARKPAPIQVTYLAYCGTTGLDTIDYRLTDPYLDPSENDDRFYSERSFRLPSTYWCYLAPRLSPTVGPLPARENGYITFGCLNSFTKVSSVSWETWRQLLQRVPQSRLVLHAREGGHRQRVTDLLANHGVDPQRLEFIPRLAVDQYFNQYSRIDIALDPYPYPGGTTTCDALWMGVPVVSLIGKTAVSRGGYSILSNIGLPELVAQTPEQYVQTAAALAEDRQRLSDLRSGLRERMLASPLLDAPRFARDVETAFRQMWRQWCDENEMRSL